MSATPSSGAPEKSQPVGFRPWAVGYASSPIKVGICTWSRWRAGIETFAANQDLPLAGIFTDGESGSFRAAPPTGPGLGLTVIPPRGSAGRGIEDSARPGLEELIRFVRDRAHHRSGFVGVVLVPTLEHLSWTRDGTQDVVRQLLRLHLSLRVETIERIESSREVPPAGTTRSRLGGRR